MESRCLVVGSGISGIAAALDLAEKGKKVLLLEKTPWIGGKLSQLDFQFPNDACGMCQVYSLTSDDTVQFCLRRVLDHPFIEVLPLSELKEFRKTKGGFEVTVESKPRGVKQICTSCHKCVEACPVEVKDEFNVPTGKRKAIYIKYPLPYPDYYAIDFEKCTLCGECAKVCPVDAIDLKQKPSTKKYNVESIIWTAGFEEVDLSQLTEFGYGRFKNVITGVELERLLSQFGPTLGSLKRPGDGKTPTTIAFIQCVGSRDVKNPFCSSFCCMYSLKETRLLKKKYPDINVKVFYMDMRTFGKGHYRYWKTTDAEFVRCRVGSIEELPDGNLSIRYEDEEGKLKTDVFELVVLAQGAVSRKFQGVEPLKNSFIPVETNVEGFYYAGSAISPRDIEESIISAYAATSYADRGKKSRKNLKKFDLETQPVIILTRELDTKLKEKIYGRFGNFKIVEVTYLREEKELKQLEKKIEAPFVLVNGYPYTLLGRLREYFHPLYFELVNVYELTDGQVLSLIESAITKLKNRIIPEFEETKIPNRILVIGGGVAGLSAASKLSEHGFQVTIVEKSEKLGGNALRIRKQIDGRDVQKWLGELIEKVERDKNISILYKTQVVNVTGNIGDFEVHLRTGQEFKKKNFGAIVVATGASEYRPEEYLYGKNPNVVTQLEFEELLHGKSIKPQVVTMIQCVGSRNDKHPYCSRVCCTDAIKNALHIKELSPETEVYILARDIVMYGEKEVFYREAREKGIIFLKFREGEEPKVSERDGKIVVNVFDSSIGRNIEIETDYLVLSAGIAPNQDNKKLKELLSIDMDEDGFLSGINPKFNPLESKKPGIFVVGLARSPKAIEESILEAHAAASRIVTELGQKALTPRKFVSIVHERKCAGCGFCVDVCPYGARYIDEEFLVAKVIPTICQGCGLCTNVCPSGAAELVGVEDKSVMEILGLI